VELLLLLLIFLVLLAPGLVRGFFVLLGLAIIGLIILAATVPAEPAERPQVETTWKKDRYGYETYRSDKGDVWKKDRYGYETWRSNDGKVCKQDRYGGAWRCK
jgi:hypothetical protein